MYRTYTTKGNCQILVRRARYRIKLAGSNSDPALKLGVKSLKPIHTSYINYGFTTPGLFSHIRVRTYLCLSDRPESIGVDVRVEEAVSALQSPELFSHNAGEGRTDHAAPHVPLGHATHIQVDVVHALVNVLLEQDGISSIIWWK